MYPWLWLGRTAVCLHPVRVYGVDLVYFILVELRVLV